MTRFATALLWSWIPIVLILFAALPPRRAAIVAPTGNIAGQLAEACGEPLRHYAICREPRR